MGRLVLARKVGQTIALKCPDGKNILITLVEANNNHGRIAFEADKSITIQRLELLADCPQEAE